FMPHSKAGRVLSEVRQLSTSVEPCTVNNCGKNSLCYKNATGGDTCRCIDGYTMTRYHGCQVTCNHFDGSCPGNATCHHVPGGGRLCSCDLGFRMVNARCIFACDRVTCPDNSNCDVGPDGNAVCSCNDGYDQMPDGTCAVTCDDYGGSCPGNATCNQVTGVGGLCSCDLGFRMVNARCISVCEMNCPANSFCEVDPVDEVVMCFCNDGYDRKQDGTCIENCSNKICGGAEECVPHEDGATCECVNGFVRVAGSCVEACPLNQCGDNSVCYKNAAGENTCACNDGYNMTPIGDCKEPCTVNNCGENSFCYKDISASDMCICNDGYSMTPDYGCQVTCDDYGGNCPGNATCNQVPGIGGLCYCDLGLGMVNAKCIPVCEMMTCPANTTCDVDPDGDAVCICNDGYVQNQDGTCVENCSNKNCNGAEECVPHEDGATCECVNGFVRVAGSCV
ncbi:unnamed protein product, partial [Closterium sp. Naga37s-1]